jgi:hypothetical protein
MISGEYSQWSVALTILCACGAAYKTSTQMRTITPTVKTEFQKSRVRKMMLVTHTSSLPPPRWARGPLSVPYRPGTPAYMFQAKTKGMVWTHTLPRATAELKPTSLHREGSGAATCPWLQTPPLCLGELQHCHMPRGSGPRLVSYPGSKKQNRSLHTCAQDVQITCMSTIW